MWADTIDYEYGMEDGVALVWRLLVTFDLKARAGLRDRGNTLSYEREQLHDSKLRRYLPGRHQNLLRRAPPMNNIEGFRESFIPGR